MGVTWNRSDRTLITWKEVFRITKPTGRILTELKKLEETGRKLKTIIGAPGLNNRIEINLPQKSRVKTWLEEKMRDPKMKNKIWKRKKAVMDKIEGKRRGEEGGRIFTDGAEGPRKSEGIWGIAVWDEGRDKQWTAQIAECNSSTRAELRAIELAVTRADKRKGVTVITDSKAAITALKNQQKDSEDGLGEEIRRIKIMMEKWPSKIEFRHMHSHQAEKIRRWRETNPEKLRNMLKNTLSLGDWRGAIEGNERVDKAAARAARNGGELKRNTWGDALIRLTDNKTGASKKPKQKGMYREMLKSANNAYWRVLYEKEKNMKAEELRLLAQWLTQSVRTHRHARRTFSKDTWEKLPPWERAYWEDIRCPMCGQEDSLSHRVIECADQTNEDLGQRELLIMLREARGRWKSNSLEEWRGKLGITGKEMAAARWEDYDRADREWKALWKKWVVVAWERVKRAAGKDKERKRELGRRREVVEEWEMWEAEAMDEASDEREQALRRTEERAMARREHKKRKGRKQRVNEWVIKAAGRKLTKWVKQRREMTKQAEKTREERKRRESYKRLPRRKKRTADTWNTAARPKKIRKIEWRVESTAEEQPRGAEEMTTT